MSFDRNILFRSNGTVLGHIHMVVGYLARALNAPFTGRFGVLYPSAVVIPLSSFHRKLEWT